jgi:hypothetical protein
MRKNFRVISRPLSIWRIQLSSLCILTVALGLALPFAGGQTQPATPQTKKTAPPKKKAATVPDGPPMTLAALVSMLNGVKQGIMDQPRILAFINKRSIDFDATPENVSTLMDAGANPEILDKVSALRPPAPPPPPPPPPKPVTGALRFHCAPAECMIRLDGGPDRITTSGRLSIEDLVYRQYTVDFRKEGYLPKSETITVSSANAVEISVILDVSPETRLKWGQQLYISVVQAIGGAKGLAEFKSVAATGGASSWNEKGSQTEWTIKTTISADGNLYELSNPTSGNYVISCQDETCSPPKGKQKGKRASGPEADALNTNLRQYNRFRLITLLQRIKSANHTLTTAAAPVTGEPNHLLVSSPEESFDITLDAASLPVAVTYRSADGLASAKISYAEYQAFGMGAKYPRLTSIALPGEKQHGIRVKYDSVAPR